MSFLADVPKCEYAAYGGCGGKLQKDHIVPVARGGNERPENLQWVCATHNIDKGHFTHEEYLAKLRNYGPPGSPSRKQGRTGRRRPWDDLVAVGKPFERDAFVALLEVELEKGNIGSRNARYIEEIRNLEAEWLVFDPDPTTWQGPLNPKSLRPATDDELRSAGRSNGGA